LGGRFNRYGRHIEHPSWLPADLSSAKGYLATQEGIAISENKFSVFLQVYRGSGDTRFGGYWRMPNRPDCIQIQPNCYRSGPKMSVSQLCATNEPSFRVDVWRNPKVKRRCLNFRSLRQSGAFLGSSQQTLDSLSRIAILLIRHFAGRSPCLIQLRFLSSFLVSTTIRSS